VFPNESTAAIPLSTAEHWYVAMARNAPSRRTARRARGRAHERAFRRNLTPVAGVAAMMAGVAIANTLQRL
jgi:uncharacterized membrane protein YdbT with pleckstrin-like domain